jgi:hypothetical protein
MKGDPMPTLFAGLDVGQRVDFTALAVVEHFPASGIYFLRFLRRVRDKPYPEIVSGLAAQFSSRGFQNIALAVDRTGPGRPFLDYLRQELPPMRAILGVTITGGHNVTGGDQLLSVNLPKNVLIQTGKLILEQRRLKNLAAFPEGDILQRELQAYQVKISAHGHEVYEGDLRQGPNDDLVFALCLSLWLAENLTDQNTVDGPLVLNDQDSRSAAHTVLPELLRHAHGADDIQPPKDKWSALRDLGYGADGSHPDDRDW